MCANEKTFVARRDSYYYEKKTPTVSRPGLEKFRPVTLPRSSPSLPVLKKGHHVEICERRPQRNLRPFETTPLTAKTHGHQKKPATACARPALLSIFDSIGEIGAARPES